MSARQVYRQVTEEGTEIQLHEDEENAHAWVEVALYNLEFPGEAPVYLSLTPKEAVAFADAVLSSSQRVEDRRPHGNS